jgi:GTP pyrophosphokinase
MSSYVSCKSFDEFLDLCRENRELNIERIQKAYKFAEKIHSRQLRKSGEPYIIHPLHVAEIILKIGGGENMICASLLHDTIEDTEGDVEEVKNSISNNFGEDVLFFVNALSKNCVIKDKDKRHKDFMEQMEEAFGMDMSVFFLKAADILHNMSTLESLPTERQKKWIYELKYSYSPLFRKYFHQITLGHREMYDNLISEIDRIIARYETKKVIQ